MLKVIRYIIVALCGWAAVGHAQPIDIYTYHHSPPFIASLEHRKGLGYDLVAAFNQIAGEPKFRLHTISRLQLNQHLAAGKPAIVLWANPDWFQSVAASQCLYWTLPLFNDKEILVMRRHRTLRDTSVEQLQGIRVGTLQGHHHPVISPLAAQGWLQAIAGDSDEENLQRLLAGKLDAVTLSKSRFLYFAKVMELAGRIEIVEPPLASYPRFIMLTAHHQSLLPIINRYLAKLSTDPSWDFRLSLYGLQYVWWNGAAANP